MALACNGICAGIHLFIPSNPERFADRIYFFPGKVLFVNSAREGMIVNGRRRVDCLHGIALR